MIQTLIQDSPCTGSLKWPIFIAQTATQTIEMTYIWTTATRRFFTDHFCWFCVCIHADNFQTRSPLT